METHHRRNVKAVTLPAMDVLIVLLTVLNVLIITLEKLDPTNALMIVGQAIMEILRRSFALHAELAVKYVEQQVLIVLNVNQLLEFLTTCIRASASLIVQVAFMVGLTQAQNHLANHVMIHAKLVMALQPQIAFLVQAPII
jgi:hypothetical protein